MFQQNFKNETQDFKRTRIFLQSQYQMETREFLIRPEYDLIYRIEFSAHLLNQDWVCRKKLERKFSIESLSEFEHQNTSQIVKLSKWFLGVEKEGG